jgi:hypothetical protein
MNLFHNGTDPLLTFFRSAIVLFRMLTELSAVALSVFNMSHHRTSKKVARSLCSG